jgi:hypothetical protein
MVLLNLLLAFGETSGCLFTKVLGSLPASLQTPFNQKIARTLVRKGGTCLGHPEVFLKIMLKLGAPGSK